uniref:ST6 N-acetylgalactosaminide alpha-2,6-sialyltransferase 5 n=1 Tax=Oncorhynchus mykiss TaxID=8022 RepID=A0A8L0DJR1_ONCMY
MFLQLDWSPPLVLSLWSSPSGPLPLVLSLWSSSSGPLPLVLSLWSSTSGPLPLVLFLWSSPSGPLPLVLSLWSSSSGPLPLVLSLWSSPSGPLPLVLSLWSSPLWSSPSCPLPLVLSLWSSPSGLLPLVFSLWSSPLWSSPSGPLPLLLVLFLWSSPSASGPLPPSLYENNKISPSLLQMHCHSCALVTSSGHLMGGGRGEEIDRAECVIRMNDAPTALGYGRDVGRRTSLRVIAHSSMQRVLRNRHELLNDTVFIFWGPSSYMRRDGKGLVYNNLRLMNQVLPKLKVYIISRQKMLQFDELFKRETGKDRRISNSWLSTGWFTMTIALELCDRINVYELISLSLSLSLSVSPPSSPSPYHYYEPLGPEECAMYISHERDRRGSHHRFITEKRVFTSWARTFNIHFYQPDWEPPPLTPLTTDPH